MAADDALGLFQSLRPQTLPPSADIHAARSGTPAGVPDLHALAMVPGTPGYNSRIPRPPCHLCGEDHVPGHDYGHAWQPEPVHDEPVSATAIMRRPAPDVLAPAEPTVVSSSLRRVVLYVGRGDSYVVAVEEAPEWDTLKTFRVSDAVVLDMINLARALGVKVQDKTGGDLLMLEQEEAGARREPETNHEGNAKGPGGRGARRQGPAANRTQEAEPSQGT